jgi:hypothetical protein
VSEEAYEVIPMRMNSIAFVTLMAVAMIASAAEAGKRSRIKATNEIVNYRAGGNPISVRMRGDLLSGRPFPIARIPPVLASQKPRASKALAAGHSGELLVAAAES